MSNFKKTVRIGTVDTGTHQPHSLFCRIEFQDGRLSISGVEGPRANGDAFGSCGQCGVAPILEYAPGWNAGNTQQFRDVWAKWHLNDMRPNCEHQTGPAWEPRDVTLYHFRLQRAVSQARRNAEKRAVSAIKRGDTFHPTREETRLANLPHQITQDTEALLGDRMEDYEPNSPQYQGDNYNRASETKSTGWLRQDEHPDGYLSKPCPVCGYKYGSRWLKEEVPAEVLDFLRSLPNTDRTPAWV